MTFQQKRPSSHLFNPHHSHLPSDVQNVTFIFIMPFGRKLEDLLNQGRSKLEERLAGNHSAPSQQNNNYPGNTYLPQQQQPLQDSGSSALGNPPPINYASKPGQKANVYCMFVLVLDSFTIPLYSTSPCELVLAMFYSIYLNLYASSGGLLYKWRWKEISIFIYRPYHAPHET